MYPASGRKQATNLPCLCATAFLPAAGATGGFAGGEQGLQQYVATGELKLRQPGQPGPRQSSPVAIAGLLVAAGAGGGLLLNEFADLGENAVKAEILGVGTQHHIQLFECGVHHQALQSAASLQVASNSNSHKDCRMSQTSALQGHGAAGTAAEASV